jgi:hypothetical protein
MTGDSKMALTVWLWLYCVAWVHGFASYSSLGNVWSESTPATVSLVELPSSLSSSFASSWHPSTANLPSLSFSDLSYSKWSPEPSFHFSASFMSPSFSTDFELSNLSKKPSEPDVVLRLSLRLSGMSVQSFTQNAQSIFLSVFQSVTSASHVDIVAVRESFLQSRRLLLIAPSIYSVEAALDVMLDVALNQNAMNTTLDVVQQGALQSALVQNGLPLTVLILDYGVYVDSPPPPVWITPPTPSPAPSDDDGPNDIGPEKKVHESSSFGIIVGTVVGFVVIVGVMGGRWRQVRVRVRPDKFQNVVVE